MAAYPITLEADDNGTFLITCDLLPEVASFSETVEDAPRIARLAIEEALAARISSGADIPMFTTDYRRQGQPYAELSSLTGMKITLQRAFLGAGFSRAELARRLDWHREQVDRLFRLDHLSRPDQLDAAFRVFGWPSSLEAIVAALNEDGRRAA